MVYRPDIFSHYGGETEDRDYANRNRGGHIAPTHPLDAPTPFRAALQAAATTFALRTRITCGCSRSFVASPVGESIVQHASAARGQRGDLTAPRRDPPPRRLPGPTLHDWRREDILEQPPTG